MKLTQNKTLFHPALFWNLLKLLSSYRLQMHVTEVMVSQMETDIMFVPDAT